MRLWFHMFGPAVGSLRVLLRRFFHEGPGPATSTLWELSGNAGNAWFMGELTVSSLNDYQVLLEATVGNTGMSDIAVDDLSFTQGPCPAAPQVAAPDAGDCTFEIDECGWASSGNRQGVEWERAPTRSLDARFRRRPRPSPHAAAHRRDGKQSTAWTKVLRDNRNTLTTKTLIGDLIALFPEYFLSLGRRPLQSAGSVTQFTSREFPGSQQPRCLTFW
ncbi:Apical endosomal glycoprotein [Gryllus bimaculatus]|nr:Apical endosomal glycoprotein [Gryllus bimaculatus]